MKRCLLAVVLCTCHPATPKTDPLEAIPIACRLDALSAEQRKREGELLKALLERPTEVRELPDGFAFRLPDDPAQFAQTAELVSLEHRCCPFLNFSLEWPGADAAPWLRVTGGERIKPFVASTFAGR